MSTPTKLIQCDALPVRIYASQADLARDVAQLAQQHLQEAIRRQGSAAVILATGNSQILFLEELIALGGVNWQNVTLFHMDEYLGIDASHRGSFRRYMRERVAARINPRQFHYVEGDAL